MIRLMLARFFLALSAYHRECAEDFRAERNFKLALQTLSKARSSARKAKLLVRLW